MHWYQKKRMWPHEPRKRHRLKAEQNQTEPRQGRHLQTWLYKHRSREIKHSLCFLTFLSFLSSLFANLLLQRHCIFVISCCRWRKAERTLNTLHRACEIRNSEYMISVLHVCTYRHCLLKSTHGNFTCITVAALCSLMYKNLWRVVKPRMLACKSKAERYCWV